MCENRVIKITWTKIEGIVPHLTKSGEKIFYVRDLEEEVILYKDIVENVDNLLDFTFTVKLKQINKNEILLVAESTGGYLYNETFTLDRYNITSNIAYGIAKDVQMDVRMYLGMEDFDEIIYKERSLSDIMEELMAIHGYLGAPEFSYKDKERLNELMMLVDKEYDYMTTKKMEDITLACINLGLAYLDMERMALVGKYLTRALKELTHLTNELDFMVEEFSNPQTIKFLIFNAAKARNYYIEDDCEDLKEYASKLLPDDELFEFPDIDKIKPALIYDSIEMTDEYLSVIDEVEEKIDMNAKITGKGANHERWQLKEEYLLEKGILWDSPKRLNPFIRFE